MHLTMETRVAEDSLKREYESRSSLEKVLQSYKDEVETLKEALNIAAQAVAQAEMDNPSSSSADALGLEDSPEQAQEASLQSDYDDYSAGIGTIPEGDESGGYDYDSAFYSTHADPYAEEAVEVHTEDGEEDTAIEELRVASDTRKVSLADLPISTRDDGSDFEDALES